MDRAIEDFNRTSGLNIDLSLVKRHATSTCHVLRPSENTSPMSSYTVRLWVVADGPRSRAFAGRYSFSVTHFPQHISGRGFVLYKIKLPLLLHFTDS